MVGQQQGQHRWRRAILTGAGEGDIKSKGEGDRKGSSNSDSDGPQQEQLRRRWGSDGKQLATARKAERETDGERRKCLRRRRVGIGVDVREVCLAAVAKVDGQLYV